MILSLFRKKKNTGAVRDVYVRVVTQARHKVFYARWGVPDSVTGRFDMISLHLCLVMRHLKGGTQEAREFSQDLFDLFFKDMDRSLREMGAGDMAVPKRIQKMGELFYGMLASLDGALTKGDSAALRATLSRNIYNGEDVAALGDMVPYVQRTMARLQEQEIGRILAGIIRFDAPDAGE
ncbi:MAG TPA: ubiquinol-cytochrome C chaperone [Devosia sp.]|nr:ubiquinol-cytochrome C chaperone [Devosia sp.]